VWISFLGSEGVQHWTHTHTHTHFVRILCQIRVKRTHFESGPTKDDSDPLSLESQPQRWKPPTPFENSLDPPFMTFRKIISWWRIYVTLWNKVCWVPIEDKYSEKFAANLIVDVKGVQINTHLHIEYHKLRNQMSAAVVYLSLYAYKRSRDLEWKRDRLGKHSSDVVWVLNWYNYPLSLKQNEKKVKLTIQIQEISYQIINRYVIALCCFYW
jgi:hypothetical protein